MPGLLRGVARTAVVAGTATAVSNRVSRRQANRWADQSEPQYAQQPQYYEPPPQQYAQLAGSGRPTRSSSSRSCCAEGPGDPDRGGVRRSEGEDPRLVARRSADALPVSATRDLDAVLAAAQPVATGRLQPAVAAAVPIHPARRRLPAAAPRDPIADLKELAALHASNALTDAEFETAKAQLLGQ